MTSLQHFEKIFYKFKEKNVEKYLRTKDFFSSPRFQNENVAKFSKKDFVAWNYGTHLVQTIIVFKKSSKRDRSTALKYTHDFFHLKEKLAICSAVHSGFFIAIQVLCVIICLGHTLAKK